MEPAHQLDDAYLVFDPLKPLQGPQLQAFYVDREAIPSPRYEPFSSALLMLPTNSFSPATGGVEGNAPLSSPRHLVV